MRLKSNLAADAALAVTTLIWGSTFVVAKDVLERWPTSSYLALRFVIATLALVVLFPRQVARAGRGAWKAGVALGMLLGGGFALQTVGLIYTTPSKSAFITGLTTPLVPLVAFLLLRVRPSLENLCGIALATVGGLLILAPRDGSINYGDLLTLLSDVLFATHITLMSVYARRHDAGQLTVLQIAVTTMIFLVPWVVLRQWGASADATALPRIVAQEVVPLVWSVRVVWQLVYLAMVGTVVTFLLWTWGQARMSATHAAVIFSLEPVFATALAVAVRGSGEWLGTRAAVGAVFVLTGVLVSEIRWAGEQNEVEGREREVSRRESEG